MAFELWIQMLLSLLSFDRPSTHDFYVSICYVQIEDSDSIFIRQRIFRNDFELAIRKDRNDDSWMLIDSDETHNVLMKYVLSHIQVTVDGNDCPLTPLEVKMEGQGPTETVTIDLAAVSPTSFTSKIQVSSQILLAVYEDQVNMVHIRLGSSKRKSKNLDVDHQQFEIARSDLE